MLNVKVIPQGKFNKVENVSLDERGNIQVKVRVTAPPADGKANAAVIKLLAEYYGLPKSAFTIKSGLTARQKVINVAGISKEYLLKGTQRQLEL
jgi:hypothetical protein